MVAFKERQKLFDDKRCRKTPIGVYFKRVYARLTLHLTGHFRALNTIKQISHESALQTQILNQLQAAKVPVHVYLKTGIKIEGVITGFDAYVIILQKANIQQIMFKHAISTVVPQDPSV